MTDLKLIALEQDDLPIISAHLQDAVLSVGDIAYLPREKRFATLVNRFDWTLVHGTDGAKNNTKSKAGYQRRRSALRIERVTAARLKNIDLSDTKRVLSLLAIQFEAQAADDPAGAISLIFAADAAIRLDVECIEAEMRDLGAAWTTELKPEHADE